MKNKEITLRDPVCGKKINRNKAHAIIKYEGYDIYLCCPRCQAEFESDPKKYLRNLNQKSHE